MIFGGLLIHETFCRRWTLHRTLRLAVMFQSCTERGLPMLTPDCVAPLLDPACKPMWPWRPSLSCSSLNSRLFSSDIFGPNAGPSKPLLRHCKSVTEHFHGNNIQQSPSLFSLLSESPIMDLYLLIHRLRIRDLPFRLRKNTRI